MDLNSRRVTRSSSGNKENNIVERKAIKETQVPRRALATLRNVEQRKVPVLSPKKHPEIVGLEREFQTADYMDDIYNYLLSKEKEFVIVDTGVNKGSISPKMRVILVDWLIQVHSRFHLFPETLHLCVYLVDLVLANVRVEKADLQLVGMACMLVAAKFEETYVPDIKDFEYIADNAFTKRQILKMEIRVLSVTGFALSRPHSILFLRWFVKDTDCNHKQHSLAKYFSEIALLDEAMVDFLPSQVALLAVVLASKVFEKDCPKSSLAKLIGWSEKDLSEGMSIFARTILRVHKAEKLVAVKNKYHSSKNSNVANLSEDALNILQGF